MNQQAQSHFLTCQIQKTLKQHHKNTLQFVFHVMIFKLNIESRFFCPLCRQITQQLYVTDWGLGTTGWPTKGHKLHCCVFNYQTERMTSWFLWSDFDFFQSNHARRNILGNEARSFLPPTRTRRAEGKRRAAASLWGAAVTYWRSALRIRASSVKCSKHAGQLVLKTPDWFIPATCPAPSRRQQHPSGRRHVGRLEATVCCC